MARKMMEPRFEVVFGKRVAKQQRELTEKELIQLKLYRESEERDAEERKRNREETSRNMSAGHFCGCQCRECR
jgi:hypothetical protein